MRTICRTNWQDEKQYPDPKTAPPSLWAWEFLRRNAGYLADWEQYAVKAREIARAYPEALPHIESFLLHVEYQPIGSIAEIVTIGGEVTGLFEEGKARDLWSSIEAQLVAFDPPKNDDESIKQYVERNGKNCSYSPLRKALGKEWGIHSVAHPSCKTVPYFHVQMGNGTHYPMDLDLRPSFARHPKEKHGEIALWQANYLAKTFGRDEVEVIAFDLRMPLEAQMEEALRYLKASREARANQGRIKPFAQTRFQPRDYRNYLRAYDANESDATVREIAKALLPHERNDASTSNTVSTKVHGWIKRAREIIDGEYRMFPIAANKAAKRAPKKK